MSFRNYIRENKRISLYNKEVIAVFISAGFISFGLLKVFFIILYREQSFYFCDK